MDCNLKKLGRLFQVLTLRQNTKHIKIYPGLLSFETSFSWCDGSILRFLASFDKRTTDFWRHRPLIQLPSVVSCISFDERNNGLIMRINSLNSTLSVYKMSLSSPGFVSRQTSQAQLSWPLAVPCPLSSLPSRPCSWVKGT